MEGKHESFYIVAARNACGHQDENERQRKKKANRNTWDISSIKRVTRKFHVVVVQNNGNFANWTYCSRCLRRLALTRFNFWLSKL